jgi:hypothetical protein
MARRVPVVGARWIAVTVVVWVVASQAWTDQSPVLTQSVPVVRSITAGQRVAVTLAGAGDEHWVSMETVAGRSYCVRVAPGPRSITPAAPVLAAFRADGSTSLGGGAGVNARVCFVAPATESVRFRLTQTDSGPRSYQVSTVETTLWGNWFFTGADYASYTILRNTTSAAVAATLTWRSLAGTIVGTEAVAVPAGEVLFRNARTAMNGTTAGSVEVAHDGDPQALVGSQTTLSAVTGQSFDTILVQRATGSGSGSRLNGPPVASAGPSQTVLVGSVVTLSGSASTDPDGDAISFAWTLAARPAASNAALQNAATSGPTFTADVPGAYTARLVVTDAFGAASVPATVKITANRLPVAVADSAQTAQDTAVDVLVLANDSDPDGDSLTILSFTQATNGAVSASGSAALRYAPTAGFFGSDGFSYTVTDGRGGTSTAAVSIEVARANQVPVATPDTAHGEPETPVTIAVLANDSDPDGDALTITGVTQGSVGQVVALEDGTIQYTQNAGGGSEDSFTYTISDGRGGTATGTVSILPPLPTTIESSPSAGEGAVAVTRETIVRLSRALDANAAVPAQAIVAEFAGQVLPSRLHVSPDGKTLTLFYFQTLPASARVRVRVAGDVLVDRLGRLVDADGDGTAGGVGVVDFDTLALTTLPGTSVTGRVFASELGAGAVNTPLAGVVVSVDGAETTLRTTTDAMGNFSLEPAPVGEFFVHIDGRAATNGVPVGAYYPVVGKKWESKAGQVTTIPDVFLPLIADGTLQPVSRTQDTVVTFPASVLAAHPELGGVQITVPADALYSDNGARGGMVGIAPVPPDRIPSPLPPGLDLPLVITVQTDSATNFDRPVPVCLPNLPDRKTGLALPARSKSALWSFNHDIGGWEIAGPMTVSADGALVCTDPEVGIRQPGWHGSQPATQSSDELAEILEEVGGCRDPALCAACTQALTDLVKNGFDAAMGLVRVGVPAGVGLLAAIFTPGPPPAKAEAAYYAWFFSEAAAAKADLILRTLDKSGQAIVLGRQAKKSANAIIGDVGAAWAPLAAEFLATRLRSPIATYGVAVANLVSSSQSAKDALTRVTQFCNLAQLNDALVKMISKPQGPTSSTSAAPDAVQAVIDVHQRESFPGVSTVEAAAISAAHAALEQDRLELPQPLVDLIEGTVETARLTEFLDKSASSDQELDEIERLLHSLQSRRFIIAGWNQTLPGYLGDLDQAIEGLMQGRSKPSSSRAFFRYSTADGTVLALGTGTPERVILPPDTAVIGEVYEPAANRLGRLVYRTGGAGSGHRGAPFVLAPVDPADSDGDGLADEAEGIVGTNIDDPDTDGDGVSDGIEIQSGTNPLDDFAAQTGVVATVDTPGTAIDVAARNDIAVVADSDRGVTVLNLTAGLNPIIIAQVDTPGTAQAVAFEDNLVAVADGAEGLAILDISDPPAARIVSQLDSSVLGGPARAVTVAGGTAYVGASRHPAQLVSIDLTTGLEVDRTVIPDTIDELVFARDELYVLTSSELRIYSTFGGFQLIGSVAVQGIPSPLENGRRLFVGGNLAYVGFFTGYSTIDVTNPASPVLLGSPPTTQLAFHDIAANGSGLLLGITSFLGTQTLALSLYDASNSADVTRFLTSFDTPGDSRALSLYNGLAYVADSEAGLQVLNYRPFDTGGVPPSIALQSNFTLDTKTGTAEEGKVMRLTALVSDDVQVRNVEFFVDGVSIARDGNFPFEHRFITPLIAARPSFTVRGCAFDTGGNRTCTGNIIVTLIPETTPPRVTVVTPSNGAIRLEGTVSSVSASFNEPIDSSSISSASFQVLFLGADGQSGTGDNTTVPGGTTSYNRQSNTALLNFASPLAAGRYHGIVRANVGDLAGNALGADHLWGFEVRREKHWISDSSGFWDDASNWNDGIVPGPTDLVAIDRPSADVVVTVRTSASVLSLRSKEGLAVTGSLSIESTGTLDGGLSLSGTLAGAGNISASNFMWTGGILSGSGSLTISGATLISLVQGAVYIQERTLRLGSSTTWSGAGGSSLNMQSGATMINPANGIIELEGQVVGGFDGFGNFSTILNEGTLRKTQAGTATLVALNNNGIVDVLAGTLVLGGISYASGSSGGSFTGAPGTILRLSATNTLGLTSQVNTDGAVEFVGTTELAGSFSAANVVFSTGARTTFSGPIGSLGTSGSLTVPLGSEVIFNTSAPLTVSDLTLSGYLAGTATLTTGSLTWTNGTLGLKAVTVTGNSTLGPGTLGMGLESTQLALGPSTVLVDGSTLSLSDSAISNPGGATWEVHGTATVIGTLTTIVNAGTIRKTQSGSAAFGVTNTDRFGSFGLALENGGILDVQSGTLILESGRLSSTSSGLFVGALGSTLRLSGTQTLTPTSQVITAGLVEFSGGTVIAGSFSAGGVGFKGHFTDCRRDLFFCVLTESVTTFSGTFKAPGPLTLEGHHLTFSGTIAPLGAVAVGGTNSEGSLRVDTVAPVSIGPLTLTAGRVSGTGSIRASSLAWSGGAIEIAALTVSGNTVMSTMDLYTTTLTLGPSTTSLAAANGRVFIEGATIINPAGGTWELRGDVTISYQCCAPAVPSIVNAGVLRKMQPGTANLGVAVNNSGTVEVLEGTLVLGGLGTGNSVSDGAFVGAAGTTLRWSESFFNRGDGFPGSTTLTAASSVSTAGTVEFVGVNLLPQASDSFVAHALVNGTFSADSLLFVDAIATFTSALNAGAMMVNTGPEGTTKVTISAPGNVATLTMNGGTLEGTAAFSSGTLAWMAGSVLIPELIVAGTTNVSGSGVKELSGTALTFGSSTTWSAGGTLRLSNGAHVKNPLGGVFRLETTGLVEGLGTSTSFTNNGTVVFGGLAQMLSFSNVEFGNDGTIVMRLGGPAEFDRIAATAPLTFGGTLDVRTMNGFVPSSGDSFQLFTYPSRAGQLNTIEGNGETYTASYGSSAFTLIKP